MDHNEATQQMIAERYLLGELEQDQRDAFEEHAFDCPECSVDLRAGAAFIGAAKVELPKITGTSSPAPKVEVPLRPSKKTMDWQSWLRPVFAIPAFAALLGIIVYQNLETIPSLNKAADEPSVLPATAFHAGTRGGAPISIAAYRSHGAVVAIELPQESGYKSFVFELSDSQGKQQWTRILPTAGSTDGTVSIVLPGRALAQGPVSLSVSGIDNQGARTEIDRRILDVHFAD